MAHSSLGIEPPPKFLESAGPPPIVWNEWKILYDNYADAIAADEFSVKRQTAILLNCLGTEGQRRYAKLEELANYPRDATNYDKAIKKLEKEFKLNQNIRTERYLFRKRAQKQGELISDYIAELRNLASTCEMPDRDDAILDQFIEKVSNNKIRERLLAEDKKLNLSKAVDIAMRMESAIRDAKTMNPSNNGTTDETSINYVKKGRNKPKFSKSNENSNPVQHKDQQKQQPRQTQSSTTCYRCGSHRHKANHRTCPALKMTCRTCGKVGHMEKVYFTTLRQSQVNELSNDELRQHILTIDSTSDVTPSPRCTVSINNTPIKFLVYSGSLYTLINKGIYKTFFSSIQLQPSDISPGGYGGIPISIEGYFETNIQYKDRKAREKIYVSENGTCILGWSTQKKLKIILDSRLDQPVLQTDSIIDEFSEVFQDNSTTVAKYFCHDIRWKTGEKPVQFKVRNIPLSVRADLTEELNKLQKDGVIEPIKSSEWISPIVVARKPSGKIRMCVDLRDVNSKIVVEKHPMPNIHEMLATLKMNKSSIYSTLDLTSAYHQVPLTERSKDITAFITPDGLFRFTRVPFGLASASSLFQRMMGEIFKDTPGVLYFQDDIFLHADSKENHDKLLRTVLSKLKHHGLTAKKEKCKFGVTNVDYLGHTISGNGIQPKTELTQAVINAPSPANKEQLRSFLGLCEYMSKFIENFASKVVPLRELMKERNTFQWTDNHQKIFDEIKYEISQRPVLSAFDSSSEVQTIVTTDASQYGLGATLSQIHNGEEKIIAFISRTLSETEQRYSVIEKEMLGCYWATKRLRMFLWGRQFTLRTDHKPLIHILTTKGFSSDRTSPRINRWSTRMLEFNYSIEYTPGPENVLADCMSRLPIPAEKDDYSHDTPTDESIANIQKITNGMMSSTEFKAATTKDSILQDAIKYTNSHWPVVSSLSKDLKMFHKLAHELQHQDGLLYRHERLVVPQTLQNRVIQIAHEGHFGMTMVKRRIRQYYWWPDMDKLVEDQIRKCSYCQTSDKPFKCTTPPLTPIPLPERVWKKIALDIQGPYVKGDVKYKFVLVLVDFYSKWTEVKFVREVTTKVVINFLQDVFSREGLPEALVTDNGVQFVSYQMTEFLQSNSIKHILSTLYHPATNGLVERMNRTIKEGIQIGKIEGKTPIQSTMERLVAYHSTPHSATGKTPFELMRGRAAHTKLTIPDIHIKNTTNDSTMREKVKTYQDKYTKQFNKRHGVKRNQHFKVGDFVRILGQRHVFKGEMRYSEPLKITASNDFCARLSNGTKWNFSKLVLVNPKIIKESFLKPNTNENFGFSYNTDVENHGQDIPPVPVYRRSNRVARIPQRYTDFVMN